MSYLTRPMQPHLVDMLDRVPDNWEPLPTSPWGSNLIELENLGLVEVETVDGVCYWRRAPEK